jgi:tetratricopeptide (TPR) repeat protein
MAVGNANSLDRALALMRQDRRLEGETLLLHHVESASSQKSFLNRLPGRPHGEVASPASPEHAKALFDLAHYLLACEDPGRAVPPLRLASALKPTDDQSKRDRLTYGMNLGQALHLAGHLEEAERVLRANVADRRGFYGDGSEGLAWGLEPLAGVLLARGSLGDAKQSADQALSILWRARSPQVANVLPLVGAIQAASGANPPFVPLFGELPVQLKLDALDDALFRARIARDRPSLEVAEELTTRCASAGLPGSERRIANAWAKLFFAARSIGAYDVALAAARAGLEGHRRSGDEGGILSSLDAIAMQLADAGRIDEAQAAFAESVAEARGRGNRLALAHSLRNWGLVLSDGGEPGWREKLEEALTTAEAAGEPSNREEVARACGALGIRVQHEGDTVRVRELLERGVALGAQALPQTDSDLFAMRTHLEAVRAGKTCGCSPEGTVEQKHAFEAAITALAQKSLPAGLLERAEFGENGNWSVKLTRQLESEDEMRLVFRALDHALAEMRAGTRD